LVRSEVLLVILSIIKLIIILGIVATIHEFGHFIFAKLFKIAVTEFSIGFGPKIFSKKYKETIYSIRWIPLGGYVLIEGEEQESTDPKAFSNKNRFMQVTVLVMGAVFNVILAFLLLVPVSLSTPTYSNIIEGLDSKSVLIQNGVNIGDKITKINGENVDSLDDLFKNDYTKYEETNIEYISNNAIKNIKTKDAVKNVGYIGVVFKEYSCIIDMVQKDKPADKTGIVKDDKIVSVNNIKTNNSIDVINIIKESGNKKLALTIERNNELIEKEIQPEIKKVFDLGITSTKKVSTNIVMAIDKTMNKIQAVVASYAELFKGKVTVDDVSSIVGIGVIVSKTEGIIEFINILAIISLAIGTANLLPIPPLDGFKILIVLIEGIIRKKIPEKIKGYISLAGFMFLILLTIIITFKDIIKLF
jgi:regulator of sigma E protease